MSDTLTKSKPRPKPKRLIKRELQANISATLRLRTYPGKQGMISSYPSTYSIWLEKPHNGVIKQYQMTEWKENYLEVYTLYNLLKEAYGG